MNSIDKKVRCAVKTLLALLFVSHLISSFTSSCLAVVEIISTFDGGGTRSTSVNFIIDASIGSIGGIGTAALPSHRIKNGYIGQLTEVTDLEIFVSDSVIPEETTSQLSGLANLDDGTVVDLPDGIGINWTILDGPLASISVSGVASAQVVAVDSQANVEGFFLGATNLVTLSIQNVDVDNFGSYASDGLPDDWQINFFGEENEDAAPEVDADHDGHNNRFEFTAGLVPTDNTSVFQMRIEPFEDDPTRKNLVFSPRFADRTYDVQFTTNLVNEGFVPLTTVIINDSGLERTVTDIDATAPEKFYRISIDLLVE